MTNEQARVIADALVVDLKDYCLEIAGVHFSRCDVTDAQLKDAIAARLRLLSLNLDAERKCEWVYNDTDAYYATGCGNAHTFIDGEICDNSYKHCPYCGGAIVAREETRAHSQGGDSGGK